MTAMPVAKRLSIDNVNFDDEIEATALDQQAIQAGMARVHAEVAEFLAQTSTIECQHECGHGTQDCVRHGV